MTSPFTQKKKAIQASASIYTNWPILSLTSSPSTLPIAYIAPTTVASLLLLENTRHFLPRAFALDVAWAQKAPDVDLANSHLLQVFD